MHPSLVDDRISALITALGPTIRVIQIQRSPEDQARAIESGASQWSGDPADAPHPRGRAVDLQPVDPPAWEDVEGWLTWAEDVQEVCRRLGINPRWGGHWRPVLDYPPKLGLDDYHAWAEQKGKTPFWDPVHWDVEDDGGGVYMQPPGYRRAFNSEVTASMLADAQASLKEPLGSFLIRDGYALGLEHHETPAKGRHKGVSVFLPSAYDIDEIPNSMV